MSGIEKWHRHLGVYGICLHEEQLLVIQKGKGPYIGRYDLPGGTVEANESLTEAVKREFIEETGIHIQIARQVGLCEYLIPYVRPEGGTTHIHHIAVFYLVQCAGGYLSITPESFDGQDSLGAGWMPLSDFTANNSSPLVQQAIDWLKSGGIPLGIQRFDDWR